MYLSESIQPIVEQVHQKAVTSYSRLTVEEMTELAGWVLEGCCMSLGYVPLAVRQVLRRHSLDEMKRLWHSARMFMGYMRRRG